MAPGTVEPSSTRATSLEQEAQEYQENQGNQGSQETPQERTTQRGRQGSSQSFFSNTQEIFRGLLESSLGRWPHTNRNGRKESPHKRKKANSPDSERRSQEEDKLHNLIELAIREAIRPLQKDVQVLTGLVSSLQKELQEEKRKKLPSQDRLGPT